MFSCTACAGLWWCIAKSYGCEFTLILMYSYAYASSAGHACVTFGLNGALERMALLLKESLFHHWLPHLWCYSDSHWQRSFTTSSRPSPCAVLGLLSVARDWYTGLLCFAAPATAAKTIAHILQNILLTWKAELSHDSERLAAPASPIKYCAPAKLDASRLCEDVVVAEDHRYKFYIRSEWSYTQSPRWWYLRHHPASKTVDYRKQSRPFSLHKETWSDGRCRQVPMSTGAMQATTMNGNSWQGFACKAKRMMPTSEKHWK